MELEKQIQADIMSAMKAHEATRLAALRGIKSAILLAKTAEGGRCLALPCQIQMG